MPHTGLVRINDIIEQVQSYNSDADLDLLRRAYVFSAKVHQGQTRLSGQPYLSHPLSVAKILADMYLDEYSVSTGLLHDTVEDTIATVSEIKKTFGDEVAFLVDGVTKISKLSTRSRRDSQAENFRKMMLAMSKDIRVILIKLADRIHNMRTLQYVPPDKQKRIAQQTMDIFVPLANRLGLFVIKRELEDLSLMYIHEKVYREIEENLAATSEQREQYVHEVIGIMEKQLQEFDIHAAIMGRPKHIHSIYSKMLTQNLNFKQIFDLTAFRIIVESRKECYEALGVIHAIWKPVPGRFKDYISLPKANMYQSLHTTVVGPGGQHIEIQIRTEEMDLVAKHGIAAHWRYKEGRKIEQKHDQRFAWIQQVLEAHEETKNSRELLEAFRIDIFPDEVYAFTPAGEVIELPKGSTPVDFAYRIHTDIGNKCVGAKVNGNIVPLRYQIQTGDVVEILTRSDHTPSRDWLKFVKTSRAKTKIRNWVKLQEREKSINLGRSLCEKEFRKLKLNAARELKDDALPEFVRREGGVKSVEDLYAAVGQGRIGARQVAEKYVPEQPDERKKEGEKAAEQAAKPARSRNDKAIRVQGMDDVMVRFGKCCNPVRGDRIKGFITRGRGVTIHSEECPFLEYADPERIIDAQWDKSSSHVAKIPLEVICEDKKGLLADITATISGSETNILNAKARTTPESKAIITYNIEVGSLDKLERIIQEIKNIKGVLKVTRIRP